MRERPKPLLRSSSPNRFEAPAEDGSLSGILGDVDDGREATEQDLREVTLEAEDGAHHVDVPSALARHHSVARVSEQPFRANALRRDAAARDAERLPTGEQETIARTESSGLGSSVHGEPASSLLDHVQGESFDRRKVDGEGRARIERHVQSALSFIFMSAADSASVATETVSSFTVWTPQHVFATCAH